MLLPSAAGNGSRSSTVMAVDEKAGRRASSSAVVTGRASAVRFERRWGAAHARIRRSRRSGPKLAGILQPLPLSLAESSSAKRDAQAVYISTRLEGLPRRSLPLPPARRRLCKVHTLCMYIP